MSVQDCLKIKKQLTDPDDKALFEKNFEDLVDGGVPPEQAYPQAAELTMEEMLVERNELAAEIREQKGYVEDLTIEQLLQPSLAEQIENVRPYVSQLQADLMASKSDIVEEPPGEYTQGDLFIDFNTNDEVAGDQIADNLDITYKQVETGEVMHGMDKVKTPAEAAHVLAPIRKLAQEEMWVLVTDKNKKPIGIVKHSKGSATSASVHHSVILGAALNLPGAKNIWLSHNHPSGNPQPSHSDIWSTNRFQKVLEGVDVKLEGHVVMGRGNKAFYFTNPRQMTEAAVPDKSQAIETLPAVRNKKLPIYERRLKKDKRDTWIELNNPEKMRPYIKALRTKSGIILLDNKLSPIGVMSMTWEEMAQLRSANMPRRILQVLDTTNAQAVVTFLNVKPTPTNGNFRPIMNLANFLARHESAARHLDSFYQDPDGSLVSFSEQGQSGSEQQPFYSRKHTEGTIPTREVVVDWLKKPVSKITADVGVSVASHPKQINPEWPDSVRAVYHNGEIIVFHRNVRSQLEAEEALAHELVGHLGLETVLGNEGFNLMVKLVQKMKRNGNRNVAAIVRELKREYIDQDGKYTLTKDQEAREILAHLAEKHPRSNILKDIWNRIKLFLMRRGFMADQYDETIINNLIFRAAAHVTTEKALNNELKSKLIAEMAGQVVEGMFGTDTSGPAFSARAPTFYSALTNAIAEMNQEKGSKQQWMGMIRKLTQKGIKQEEIDWSDVMNFIAGYPENRISKTAILDHIDKHEIRITEIVKEENFGGLSEPEMEEFNALLSDNNYLEMDTLDAAKKFILLNGTDWAEIAGINPDGFWEESRLVELGEVYRLTADRSAALHMEYQTQGDKENYQELLLIKPARELPLPDGYKVFPAGVGFNISKNDKPIEGIFASRAEAINSAREAEGMRYDGPFYSPRSHFEEKNILAHVRFNTRTINGKKTLFIEEIQSDWHQAGRQGGYRKPVKFEKLTEFPSGEAKFEINRSGGFVRVYKKFDGMWQWIGSRTLQTYEGETEAKQKALDLYNNWTQNKANLDANINSDSVSDAPFKRSWPLLAIKRMIRHAVDNNFDQIAWTSGSIQAQRYSMETSISKIKYTRTGDLYDIEVYDEGTPTPIQEEHAFSYDDVVDFLGQTIADQMKNNEGVFDSDGFGNNSRILNDIDLSFGGEGMKAFYDKMLPNMVDRYVKKMGSRVQPTQMNIMEQEHTVLVENEETGEWEDVIDGMNVVPFDNYDEALNWANEDLPLTTPFRVEPLAQVGTPKALDVWTLPITDRMMQAANKGQPMFSRKKPLSANERKGDLDIVQNEYPEIYEAVQARMKDMPKAERKRLKQNLKEFRQTGWAAATVKSLAIRQMYEMRLRGENIDAIANSDMWGNESLFKYKTMMTALAKGEHGVELLTTIYDFVGNNRKAENDVSGSFINCDPSEACAKFCYAVSANTRNAELMKAEFTEMVAEKYPEKLADRIEVQYSGSHAGHSGLSLRLNDKGDLSLAQVKLIKALNRRKIPLQVFSKRPELLRQLSDVNLKMLSIDDTNFSLALNNPDLQLAVTLTDQFTEDMVKQINDRVAVYLPVNLRGKNWTTDDLKMSYPETYKEMTDAICPIDSGKLKSQPKTSFVNIIGGHVKGLWTCTACDKQGAVGCFHGKNQTKHRQAAFDLLDIEVNTAQERADIGLDIIRQELEKLQQSGDIDGQSAEAALATLREGLRISRQEGTQDKAATDRAARSERSDTDPDGNVEDRGTAGRDPQFSRRRHPPTETTREQEAEEEVLRKLGMAPTERRGLIRRLRDLKAVNWKQAGNYFAERTNEGIFDGIAGFKYAEESVGAGISAGDYTSSSYVMARLATGIADMMTHVLHYGAIQWKDGVPQGVEGTEGLLKIMTDLGPDADNWLMWMAGNRGEELMDQGREANLTADDIQFLKSKAQGKQKKFMEAKRKYNAMNKAMLDFAQDAGLINKDARKEWESEWYIPFYRQDDEGEVLAPHTKRGFSHQTAGIKHLAGSDKPTADLLENILTNWMKLVDSSVKNMTLVKMVENLKDSDYITPETLKYTKAIVPKGQIADLIQADRDFAKLVAEHMGMSETATNMEIIDEMNTIDKEGMQELWALTIPKDPRVLQIKRNGKNEYWRIADGYDSLLRATGMLGFEGFQDPVTRAGRYMKQLLTIGVTSSPDFMLRNFVRDAAHAWAINKDGFQFGRGSLKGLKGAFTEDSVYRAMMAGGASFQGGYVHGTDPKATADIIRRQLEKEGLTRDQIDAHMASRLDTMGKLWGAVEQGWQTYRGWGDKFENSNRHATAKAAIDAGKSVAQVLYESKDLMDYSMRGNFLALMYFTDMVPFMNARIQGLSKLVRAGVSDPKIVMYKAAKIAAISAALALWNADDDRYQELPDWEKDAYWHIFMGEQHWRIPKPFEIGILAGTIPERIVNAWVTDTQPDSKLIWSLGHNAFETLNLAPYPQFVLPVAEVWANKSMYFGTPIENESDKGIDPRMRYNERTSDLARYMTNNDLADWMGMSPKRLQYLFEGYTGTMGAYALSVADMMIRVGSGAPDKPQYQLFDAPVVKSFYRGDRVRGTQYGTDFYDRLQEVEQMYRSYTEKVDRAQADRVKLKEAKEYYKERKGKLKYRPQMLLAQRQIKTLRDQMDTIMRSNKSAQVKYDERQRIQAKMNRITERIARRTQEAFDQ